jgi:hypothetical protein
LKLGLTFAEQNVLENGWNVLKPRLDETNLLLHHESRSSNANVVLQVVPNLQILDDVNLHNTKYIFLTSATMTS